MCGRNSLFVDQDNLQVRFDAEVVADGGYQPRYNIAPGDGLEVITNKAPNSIDRFTWGFEPDWADSHQQLINARVETVDETPVFKEAWDARPCLVLSSGFYEWESGNRKTSQPYRIYRAHDQPFAMAGIWQQNETGAHATILTTDANTLMEPIHDRMPVILPETEESTWLNAGSKKRKRLCQPYAAGDLRADAISTKINDPANDVPEIIEPLGHAQSGLGDFN